MRDLFVCEYLSAWPAADEAPVARALEAEGRAMRFALIQDLARVDGLSLTVAGSFDEVERTAASSAGIALPRCVARPHGESVLDVVAGEARHHRAVWVVAPESAGVLHSLCEVVPPDRWVGCDAASIRAASSKRTTLARLAAQGVPTPLSFDAPTAWVVKPDDGAGAAHTRRYDDLDAARAERAARHAAGRSVTLEPWVEGDALSLSLLCRADGVEVLSLNRQQVQVRPDGTIDVAGVTPAALPIAPHAAALQALADGTAAALPGLRGFVGLDLVWHAQRGPVVIEVNPRLTSAYVGLSAALGRNVAVAALQASGLRGLR